MVNLDSTLFIKTKDNQKVWLDSVPWRQSILEWVTVLVSYTLVFQWLQHHRIILIFPFTSLFKFPLQLFRNASNYFLLLQQEISCLCAPIRATKLGVCARMGWFCVKRSGSGGNGCIYNASGVHFHLAEAPDAAESSISGFIFPLILKDTFYKYLFLCVTVLNPAMVNPATASLSSDHGPLFELSGLLLRAASLVLQLEVRLKLKYWLC